MKIDNGKLKIITTGGNGQLGRAIREIAYNYDYHFIFTDLDELDITNRIKVDEYFSITKPDIVINCAAYTNVDKAESDQETACKVNVQAVENLAAAAVKYSIKIIHISTDFVFDGHRDAPYTEDILPNPINVYGKSKYEGEQKLIFSAADALILRTSWLFSEFGHNFVKTIYNLAQKKSELKVVNDQYGSPTYAIDLAKAIMEVIESDKWKNGCDIYHFCNQGIASWYDIASEIVNYCGFKCKIIPVSTEEYDSGVNRPKYSVLDTSKIRGEFSLKARQWREAIASCIEGLRDGEVERSRE